MCVRGRGRGRRRGILDQNKMKVIKPLYVFPFFTGMSRSTEREREDNEGM